MGLKLYTGLCPQGLRGALRDDLAGVVVALLRAGLLPLARLLKLGFLADFLSRTVLVGFLTGVGLQVGIAMLGGLLGIAVTSPGAA